MKCERTGKQKLTKAQAKKSAAWWRHRLMAFMYAYKCPAGGHWHIGNRRPSKNSKNARRAA